MRDQLVPALRAASRVDVLSAGERVQRADVAALSADGRRTDLPGAIAATRDRYRDRDLAGIVLISDGGNLVPLDHAASSRRCGGSRHHGGRRRRADPVRPRGAQRDRGSVCDGREPRGHHRHDRGPWRDRPIAGAAAPGQPRARGARRDAAAPTAHPVQLVFPVQPDSAMRPRSSAWRSAPTLASSRQRTTGWIVLVPAPGRPRRILFIEGAPGFEHTFLRRAWQLDPSLEIDSVVQKGRDDQGQDTYYVQAASSRTAALSTGFPASREALYAYDAVVLANANLDALPARCARGAHRIRRRAGRRPARARRARAVAPGACTVDARTRAAGGPDRSARRPRAAPPCPPETASRWPSRPKACVIR